MFLRCYGDDFQTALTDLCRSGAASESVEVASTEPPNWITSLGAAKKRKAIAGRLPCLRNARFITLTVDPSQYADAEECYEVGKRHMRQFLYELGKLLGVKLDYCWKLEFHESGYPHWHMILFWRRKLKYQLINQCWRLGRTDIQRIKSQSFDYLFKYAAKSVNTIPDYIAKRKQVRFFQTSRGLLAPEANSKTKFESAVESIQGLASPRPVTEKESVSYTRKESTLGERLGRWLNTLSIKSGNFIAIVSNSTVRYEILIRRAVEETVAQLNTLGESVIRPLSNKIIMPRSFTWLLMENINHA